MSYTVDTTASNDVFQSIQNEWDAMPYAKSNIQYVHSPKRKLMVCGHGRHGKDTLCELLQKHGFTFQSSSSAASKFIYEVLKDKYGYKDAEGCFNDRANHRKEWFDLICEYNKDNPTALAELIYKDSDIYCGIRSLREFNKGKEEGLFDLSIWVDASKRLPAEGEDSNEIKSEHCDIVIHNNGTLEEFEATVNNLLTLIK